MPVTACPSDVSPLTAAQSRILALLPTGLDDAGMASATGITVRTIRAHVGAILVALGARTRLEAGVEAARRGWLRGRAAFTGGETCVLTPFDHRILVLLAQGHRDEQVANLTCTSTRTVRRRVTVILAGLGVQSRFAAGVEAFRRGLLSR